MFAALLRPRLSTLQNRISVSRYWLGGPLGINVSLFAALLLPTTVNSQGIATAPPAPTKPSVRVIQAGIAAVRRGDLWVTDGSGRPPQQVTRGGSFQSVSVGASSVAAVNDAGGEGPKTNVFVWRPLASLAQPVTRTGNFAGVPLWLPGTEELLVGRLKPNADADGGLWLVDARSRAIRRVLPNYDADFPVNNHLLLSPSGDKVVSFDGSEANMTIQVLEIKTLTPLTPPTSNGLRSLTDIAWLDDDTLLLSGASADAAPFPGQGGIRALDLRTRRLRRWLYSANADVQQLVRAPKDDLFAVGLGHARSGSQHIRIVDARTKAGRSLPLPSPAKICGFSGDGSQLLVLLPAQPGESALNAYAVDLKTGIRRLLMSSVSDAAWR